MTSIQPSNYTAILNAIFTIATTSTVAFGSKKMGEVPTPEELSASLDPNNSTAGGWPWFSVRQGKFVGYAVGTELQKGTEDDGMRGLGGSELVWDFECYMMWPYTVQVPNYDVAATAMTQQYVNFYNNLTLNNTCSVSTFHSPGLQYVDMENVPITAVRFVVRAYEILYDI